MRLPAFQRRGHRQMLFCSLLNCTFWCVRNETCRDCDENGLRFWFSRIFRHRASVKEKREETCASQSK